MLKNPDLRQFGEQVRQYRKSKGLSQETLAELTGLHRTYIGGIERGERNVSLLNIIRIAKVLEIPPYKLIETIE
jgi:transcriptional regulator with XRE-family HTH domain